MARKQLENMTVDEVFGRWQERFKQIHYELSYLFSTRRKFFDIREMFRTNPELGLVGNQAYDWLLNMWGRDATMAVRRELDSKDNTIALGTLLDEMASRPEVLTRGRYMAFLRNSEQFLVDLNDEAFSKWGVVKPTHDPLDDHLDPAVIRADRQGLNKAAARVLNYANRIIAHRTPVGVLLLSTDHVNAVIDAIEPVFQKYHVIMTGAALVRIEPYNQGDDWRRTFMFPWYIPPALPDEWNDQIERLADKSTDIESK